MALNSMTGFARSDGHHGDIAWAWELRSVNGRGLDLRLRLPSGLDAIEPNLRKAVTGRFARGNISATLTMKRDGGSQRLRLNEAVLNDALDALGRVRELAMLPEPRADSILAIRGVLELVDGSDEATTDDALAIAITQGFETAVVALAAARASEGAALAGVLSGLVDQIDGLVQDLIQSPARGPDRVLERLSRQVTALLERNDGLDPARLHQEAVLIATRADIQEELDRLVAHIAAARGHLAAAEPVGRKLDFLAQEFNREANTICSKAGDIAITQTGLALKGVIDQLREQVQNVE